MERSLTWTLFCVVFCVVPLELIFSWVFTEYFSHCGFSSDFSRVDVGHHPPKSGLNFRPQLLCFGWLFKRVVLCQ